MAVFRFSSNYTYAHLLGSFFLQGRRGSKFVLTYGSIWVVTHRFVFMPHWHHSSDAYLKKSQTPLPLTQIQRLSKKEPGFSLRYTVGEEKTVIKLRFFFLCKIIAHCNRLVRTGQSHEKAVLHCASLALCRRWNWRPLRNSSSTNNSMILWLTVIPWPKYRMVQRSNITPTLHLHANCVIPYSSVTGQLLIWGDKKYHLHGKLI